MGLWDRPWFFELLSRDPLGPVPDVAALEIGALCRTVQGSPARYLGGGMALAISCQDNDLMLRKAAPPTGGEDKFPLPTDQEIEEFRAP